MSVSFEEFSKIEMRVGRIISVEDIPKAKKPMYKMLVDFGNGKVMQCVGGIKEFYTRDELIGRLVVAVVNLKPKPIAGVSSECMLLAAYDEKTVSLVKPDRDVPLGMKVG